MLKKLIKNAIRKYASVKVFVNHVSENELLAGRCAFVSGGTSGIGFEIAKKIVSSGGRCIVGGTNEKKINYINSLNDEHIRAIHFDIQDLYSMSSLPNKCEEMLGSDIDPILIY